MGKSLPVPVVCEVVGLDGLERDVAKWAGLFRLLVFGVLQGLVLPGKVPLPLSPCVRSWGPLLGSDSRISVKAAAWESEEAGFSLGADSY